MINSVSNAEFTASYAKDTGTVSRIQNIGRNSSGNFSGMIEKNSDRPVDEKLMGTCIEMESIMVGKMIKEMRKTLHKEDSLLYGGMAEEIFEDMLYDEYALSMSRTSSNGIAAMLYEQLS